MALNPSLRASEKQTNVGIVIRVLTKVLLYKVLYLTEGVLRWAQKMKPRVRASADNGYCITLCALKQAEDVLIA